MSENQELKGLWHEIKGKIKERWGQITEDDLTSAKGSFENLLGIAQRKTGAAKREIEDFLNRCLKDCRNSIDRN